MIKFMIRDDEQRAWLSRHFLLIVKNCFAKEFVRKVPTNEDNYQQL